MGKKLISALFCLLLIVSSVVGIACQKGATTTTAATTATTTATATSTATTTAPPTFTNLDAFNKLVEADWAKWTAPSTIPTLTGPKGVPGKKVMFIGYLMAADSVKTIEAGARQAAQILGWELTTVDLKGNVAAANEAIDQAILTKVDGVIFGALDASYFPTGLQKLKQAGIPAGSISGENTNNLYAFTAGMEENQILLGRLQALTAYKLSGGKMKAVYLYSTGVNFAINTFNAFNDFVNQARSAGADVQVVDKADIPVADFAKIPAAAVALVQKNSSYNVFASAADSWMDAAYGGLSAAGLTTDPNKFAVGISGSAGAMDRIRKGNFQTATVGRSNFDGGFQAIDALNRIFAGQQPVPRNSMVRIITKAEAEKYPAGSFPGDADIAAAYKAMWGK